MESLESPQLLDPAKAEVLRLLDEGRLVTARHHRSAVSSVWTRFSLLVRPGSGQAVGFVQCSGCRAVLRYDSHRTGTSSLKRHRCILRIGKIRLK